MVGGLLLALGLLGAPTGASAGDLLAREFAAPVERVWRATLAALAAQKWGVDEADQTIGAIITKSHRLDGEEGRMWSTTTRLRLRLSVIPLGDERARVSVEREVFRRERMFWVERDHPIDVVDPARANLDTEDALLSAIAAGL
jgi:hypothetical protein